MKALIKVSLSLFAAFLLILLVVKGTGLVSLKDIESALMHLKGWSPLWVGFGVAFILAVDIVLSVPTVATILFSGYLIGFWASFSFCLLGLTCVGATGYLLGAWYGQRFLHFMEKDEVERQRMSALFLQYGFVTIVVSRAIPMLPEVAACLAGMTRMNRSRYALAWLLGAVPYCAVLSYAGSISSFTRPYPSLFAYFSLIFLALTITFFFRRNTQDKL